MSVALRAGCQRAHKVLMKMGETVVRNGDGLDRCCGLCGNFGPKRLHSFEKNFCPTLDFSRAGNLFIRSLLMCSCAHFAQDKWVTVSKLLRSFRGNEQSWAICSGRSEEMRNLSELLISLMKKWANERLAQKIWLKNLKYCFTVFYSRFFSSKNERIAYFCSLPLFWWGMWVNRSFCSNQMSDVSELLISLTKKELPWAIHSGCLEEMSDVSEFLISLTKNERMSESLIFWANHSFFLHKKTSNSLRNQMSEFPTLNCRSPNPNFQHTTLAPKF